MQGASVDKNSRTVPSGIFKDPSVPGMRGGRISLLRRWTRIPHPNLQRERTRPRRRNVFRPVRPPRYGMPPRR